MSLTQSLDTVLDLTEYRDLLKAELSRVQAQLTKATKDHRKEIEQALHSSNALERNLAQCEAGQRFARLAS